MSRRRWTAEETEFLKENFEEMTSKELADRLDKTESSVNNKLRRLKLKKTTRWNDGKILERIRKRRAEGLSLLSSSVQEEENALYSAASRHFGSWSNAVEEAGFDYEQIRRSR